MLRQCTKCKVSKKPRLFPRNFKYAAGRETICRQCKRDRRRSFYGLPKVMYLNQRSRANGLGFAKPDYSRNEFIQWLMSQSHYKSLYALWEASEYDSTLTPSVGRIDRLKGFTLSNLYLASQKQVKRGLYYEDEKTNLQSPQEVYGEWEAFLPNPKTW